jgi:hypothetical protein
MFCKNKRLDGINIGKIKNTPFPRVRKDENISRCLFGKILLKNDTKGKCAIKRRTGKD